MVEQSANDMNQIREQRKDVENQVGVSGQKIKELDAGHQTLVEKILGMENGVPNRLEDLTKLDASLRAKLSALESINDRIVRISTTASLEKKIHNAEHRLDQLSKEEIQSVGQHLEEQRRTSNSDTERRLADADAGSQQPLKKLLEVKKDVEGKESINIQETKKADAERQRSEAKAKEDLDANAAANARAIADFKDQLGETIAQRVKSTETTKSVKEVQVLTERIQSEDLENQSDLTDQKIKEPDAGNQNLLEVLSMVSSPSSNTVDTASNKEEEYAFLLLSRRESSKVLQTGQEINELTSSGFCTTSATVYASSVLDPHLAEVSQEGKCAVLTLEGEELTVTKVRVGDMPGRTKSPMVCFSLDRDTSGLLTKENRLLKDRERPTHRQVSAARQQEADEEEELFYGDSSSDGRGDTLGEGERKVDEDQEQEAGWRQHLRSASATYGLTTVRANDFPHLPDVLADATRRHPDRTETPRGLDSTLSPLTELLLVFLPTT